MRLLESNEIDVWYLITQDLSDEEIRTAVDLLSHDEIARYSRFRFACDRRDYAAAHALLRTALSNYSPMPPREWVFERSGIGKPTSQHCHQSFSLSHTRGLVACAVAPGIDVGIDVEVLNRSALTIEMLERCFSPVELAQLASLRDLARRERIVELWTLKEAYAKATGEGLAIPLDSVSFSFNGKGEVVFSPPLHIESKGWQFKLFVPTPHHRMAVVLRRRSVQDCKINILPVNDEWTQDNAHSAIERGTRC